MLKLYEFSSGVIAEYNAALGDWEFIRYEVGEFMSNSFTLDNSMVTNYRGIPEVIDRAIRNEYFAVKTPSYGKLALTGRYLEDDWAVLVISDQLAGRPNELYRYFCVRSPLTEKVDPMLSLLDWYSAQSPPLQFDPNPRRDVRVIDIPESPPYGDVNQLNKRERSVLEKLNEGGNWERKKITLLNLEEVRNIIAMLPLSERKVFSWAIGAYNVNLLVSSGNFCLVQSSNGDLYITEPKISTRGNMLPRTVDRKAATQTIKQLVTSPESSDFNNRLMRDLFKQEVDEENWKIIFDSDIGVADRLNTNHPDVQDINFLILQAILIPERIIHIFRFLSRGISKDYKRNFEEYKKHLLQFEQKLQKSLLYFLPSSPSEIYPFSSPSSKNKSSDPQQKQENYRIFSQLIEQVYQGVWIALNHCLESENNNNISVVQGFLQHESNWFKRNLLSRHKRNSQGLWEFALISKVRFDFYNHIHPTYPPSEPAKLFFEKFNSQKEQKSIDFLKKLWEDDPIITTWLYQQTEERIPYNTFKTIEHLGYVHQQDTILLKDFFFPDSNLHPMGRWEPIAKRLFSRLS